MSSIPDPDPATQPDDIDALDDLFSGTQDAAATQSAAAPSPTNALVANCGGDGIADLTTNYFRLSDTLIHLGFDFVDIKLQLWFKFDFVINHCDNIDNIFHKHDILKYFRPVNALHKHSSFHHIICCSRVDNYFSSTHNSS
ncbi:Hypothetical predicted protein [Lecanosticta acicola]|uniref:Uncharacterized protein n=1 Tax=Lecanosticta acicola TaxID=111012 RepID=A0AAI8YRC8_9PEZI|nr:Hypothetical predicted protein [Lecanosticta acicola]